MISHDHDFMNTMIETVIKIDPNTAQLISYTKNYTTYLDQRKKRYELQVQTYRNQNKKIKTHMEFIKHFHQINSKTAQMQSRIKLIDKIKRIEKPRTPHKPFKFTFPQPPHSNQKVVELIKSDQSYPGKHIYKDLDLTIKHDDKIVLINPNGTKKTTLLKLLADELEINTRKKETDYLTKINYYSQHHAEALNEFNSVLNEIMNTCTTLHKKNAHAILNTFLFHHSNVEKKYGILSNDEKSQLNLVKFLIDPPNLLLINKPTTHLDILSINSLINALKAYEGTLIFISHDVHFIHTLAETTLHVTRNKKDPQNNALVTHYTNNYNYFLEKSDLNDNHSTITS